MSENYEAIGRYVKHMQRIEEINARRRSIIETLQRWSATASNSAKRAVTVLRLDDLEDALRELRKQQGELEQLAHAINAIAQQIDEPPMRFIAHQVL